MKMFSSIILFNNLYKNIFSLLNKLVAMTINTMNAYLTIKFVKAGEYMNMDR